MSALALTSAGGPVDPLLTGDVLAHLDAQIASAARLLQIVVAQGQAIRAQDVDAVIRQVSAFHAELERRSRLEEDRARLLRRAAVALRTAPEAVTLTALGTLMAARDASVAHTRSSELRGLLDEVAREHSCNQALMRQELAFLDHLLRLVEPEPALGYAAGGTRQAMPKGWSSGRLDHRALDLHA